MWENRPGLVAEVCPEHTGPRSLTPLTPLPLKIAPSEAESILWEADLAQRPAQTLGEARDCLVEEC